MNTSPLCEAGIGPEPSPLRRDLLRSTLAAGFAAAVSPIQASTAIQTGEAGLEAGTVQVPAGDRSIPAYRAAPAGRAGAPLLLVVQEIFGVHEYIRDVCRRLAHAGYCAVAPELYVRQGDPSTIADTSQIVSRIVSKVPDEQVLSDLDACVDWAGAHGADAGRVGITGFCWGGRIVWLYCAHLGAQGGAHADRLKAGVAWYGRLEGTADPLKPRHPIDVVGSLRAPVLGLYGAADPGIPIESIDRMKAALARAGGVAAKSQFVVYPGAGHAFHADYRPSYVPEAARDGWEKCLRWFQSNLG